jgi:hypothetical protein
MKNKILNKEMNVSKSGSSRILPDFIQAIDKKIRVKYPQNIFHYEDVIYPSEERNNHIVYIQDRSIKDSYTYFLLIN